MTIGKVLYKRGTQEANEAYTGALGEITIDLTMKALRVHDGVTPGGVVHFSRENFNALFLQHFPELNPVDVNLTGGNIDGQAVSMKIDDEFGWDNLTSDLTVVSGGLFNQSAPSFSSFRNGIRAYSFSQSTSQEANVRFRVPHDYAPGTKIYPNIQWGINTTNTGTVRWGFEFTVAKSHNQGAPSVFGPTSIVYAPTTISTNSQYRLFHAEVSEANAIPAEQLEPDSLILIRVFRDVGNDNFNNAVFGFQAGIHYQKRSFATRNKAPDFYSLPQ